jgi:hypothetical protein
MGATYSGEYRILYSVGCGDFVLFEEKDTMGHFFHLFSFFHSWCTDRGIIIEVLYDVQYMRKCLKVRRYLKCRIQSDFNAP